MSMVFWLFAVCLVGCSCICHHRSQDCTVPATKPPVTRALSSLHWLEVCTKTKIHNQLWVHLQSDLLRLGEVKSPVNQSNDFIKLALSYCKNGWLVATLSPHRLGFIPRPESKWIRWQQDWFFSGYFGFPLFVPFHQCSTHIHLLLTLCGLSICQYSPFSTRIICLV